MKVYLASDHAGFYLKGKIFSFLTNQGYQVIDCGSSVFNREDDYPDFILKAGGEVAKNTDSFGIVFGKSGEGEAICANKIKGIRAAIGFNEESARLARSDNDANVLSLGSEFVDEEKAKELVKIFLETPFSNEERHKRRIEKISDLEKQ